MTVILSKDVLKLIFQHLSVPELGQCATVCQRWKEALMDDDDDTTVDGDSTVSVWRFQMEEIFWASARIIDGDNGSWCPSFRQSLKQYCSREQELVQVLGKAPFHSECDSKSWLLCAHSSRVLFMECLFCVSADTSRSSQGHHPPVQKKEFLITISVTGEVFAWTIPLAQRRPIHHCVMNLSDHLNGDVTCVESLPCPKQHCHWLLLGCFDGNAFVLELSTNRATTSNMLSEANTNGDDFQLQGCIIQCLEKHPRPIHATCSCSSSNPFEIATACADGWIRVFTLVNNNDMATNKQLFPIEVLPTRSWPAHGGVCVARIQRGISEGTLWSQSPDQTIRLWNYHTGECLYNFQFDNCVGGGPNLLGCHSHEIAVFWETLEETMVSVRQIATGRDIWKVSSTLKPLSNGGGVGSRFHSADLHGDFLVCGTQDGHLKEFDFRQRSRGHAGRCALTCQTTKSLGSSVTFVAYTGASQNHALALLYDGVLVLLKKCPSSRNRQGALPTLEWKVVRTIELNMRTCGGTAVPYYYAPHQTLFIASPGYLVRAFVFENV